MSDSASVKQDIQQLYRQLIKQLELKPRWGQKQMIATVANHFLSIDMDVDGHRRDDNPVCLVEAGTGTGKTLAYMVACLPIAKALDKKLVISTATIALQEQIVQKDLPALKKHGGYDFDFQLAKGRRRYLCVSRLDQALSQNAAIDPTQALFEDELALKLDAQQQTLYKDMVVQLGSNQWDGDRDAWKDSLAEDHWRPITTDHKGCTNRRCSHFSQCPFFKARDGLEIPAYLTLTKKKTKHKYMIMLPHGGPNVKQGVGFDHWVQFFANKGYNVIQMDYRGSTGLGTSHYVAGNMQWGKKMQDDISDGVFWAIDNGYADADRVCIAGASYGGYATMAGLTFTPELYRCGINAVGVVNQKSILEEFSTKAGMMNNWTDEAALEWGDLSNEEGKQYVKDISPVLFVDNIIAPVLVLQGTNDNIVPPVHARELIKELKRKNKTYMAMFQAEEGHCVKCGGEQASLEYFDIQEEFLKKYLEN